MRGRGESFKEFEDAFLRLHYRTRGRAWCAEHLEGRTAGSIAKHAIAIGIARTADDAKVTGSEQIDAVIRRAYTGPRPHGFVSRCATQVGRTRDWVAKRALTLGLITTTDHRPWSEEEATFASTRPMATPVDLSRQMRRRGWLRTPSSIAHMRSSGRIEMVDPHNFTAAGLATALGVSTTTVTGWIGKAMLRATRRGWNRTEAQKGDGYVINERDVAAFIVQHPAAISLSKLEPNKAWFIDLMARCAAPASLSGRQKGATILQIAEARPDLAPGSIATMVGSTPGAVSTVISQAKAGSRRKVAA